MSVSISYFFNYDMELEETASSINAATGSLLRPYTSEMEDTFTTSFMGMDFDLALSTGYEDDGELDFKNFKFSLGFTTYRGGADTRPIHLVAMLTVIYLLHRRMGIIGMLVFDAQTILARYVEQETKKYGESLFDVLSQELFVNLPAHLAAVRQRLPEAWQQFY